ncbi:ABC transporter substrate-binding protein [Arthrobacter sp. MYb23]|uniref:ABC transporter substrate-binding protein n=1 Tax=unclassified Arthrobacter TaxID=235627 RepID=UPI000CFBBD52|nr:MULTISPECIES: sugar ABC transporter substrate-binding protein [unclassified Arthrobacter]PRB37031.1 ABC transporter substrate-binding protein [Arthrobacter sp. MYb51]PRB90203.1 ABC transporter substrate-binding protein [Arthrobacter sp. MYb23]
MKRRQLLLGAVSLMATTALITGCGSTQAAAPTPTEDPSGTITFWSSMAGMDKVAEAFNASQSKIKVTFETIPNGGAGGYAKLSTAITAGNGPDVATIEYPQLPQFVSNGQLQPLDGFINKAETVDKLTDETKALVQFGDATYALPYDAAPMIMWYRKDMLDKAGVGVPKTWQDFEEAGKKLKAVAPEAHLASFNPNEAALTAALSWQAGAKWFGTEGDSWKVGINDEATQKVANYWQKLIDQKIVKVQQSFSDEWSADLASGAVVGVLGANWSATGIQKRTEASGQKGQWIAAEAPNWGSPADAFYGGSSFNITKSSKNPAAAAKFIEFLATSQDAVKARGNTGSAFLAYPGLTPVAQQAFDSSYFGNDIYAVFDKAYASITPGWQWGPNWDITNTALKDAYGKLTSGGKVLDAVDTAQSATVTGLKQNGLSVKE